MSQEELQKVIELLQDTAWSAHARAEDHTLDGDDRMADEATREGDLLDTAIEALQKLHTLRD